MFFSFLMDLSEFYGMRVRIVLVLLRKGAMTQTALARELKQTPGY